MRLRGEEMETIDILEKSRSREIDDNDPIRTLLNSLTLENIRDAAYLLAPGRNVRIKNHSTSLEDILQTGKSTNDIIEGLLEIEAHSPFKHCLITKCIDGTSVELLNNHINNTLSFDSFDFLIRYYEENQSHIFVTIEHTVIVEDWAQGENENIRRKEKYYTRHPIILRMAKATGLLLLSYPGFSQGRATKKSSAITYSDLLGAVIHALENIGIKTKALPIQNTLKLLMTGSNRRVRRIRTDIEAANIGRFDLSSLDQQKTVEESLADLFFPYMASASSREGLIDLAKRAINDTDANFTVLYWADEAVTTRLLFWTIGCEMLFTWGGKHASYRAIDSILEMILESFERFSKSSYSTTETPFQWIAAQNGNEVIKPAAIAERFQLTATDARKELVHAIKAGMLYPVYRLISNTLLIDSMNDWTDDPRTLSREWVTDSGEVIDGADPRNLEVAFRRTV